MNTEARTPLNTRISRSRRSRRRVPRDARWLADELSRGASGGFTQARALVKVVDEVLRSVERIAWDVRDIARTTSTAWGDLRDDVSRDAVDTAEELRDLRSDVGALPDKYRRLAATALMLGRVAVSYRLHTFRSAFMSRDGAARSLEGIHAKNARHFYTTSVAHGGAFLKVGQLLSARHDLLPDAWLVELEKLQDSVPALDFDPIRDVLEADLAQPIEELFTAIDSTSLAAASIGQVHRAVTPDGLEVAVKIQRPGVAELIETDLGLLDLFLESVRSMLPPTDLETVRDEIKSVLTAETDYALERETMRRVSEFFEGHAAITVPAPVASHSGERVLTSRFIEGRKITVVLDELAAQRDAGDENAGRRLDRVMGLLLEAYLRMVLELGVFQADPHPGNLLVTTDERLVVLDFGAARSMSDETRRKYLGVMQAFIFDDVDRLSTLLLDLGFETASGRPDTLVAFANALLREMKHAVQEKGPFQWPTKEQFLEQAADLLRQADRDPVTTLPPEFVMIGRVFGTLGGLFGHYRPGVDVASILIPIIGRALLA
jgi:ubiquinone biosynthesis protein